MQIMRYVLQITALCINLSKQGSVLIRGLNYFLRGVKQCCTRLSNSLLAEGSEAHSLSEESKHAINRTAINCVAILYSTAVFFCLEAEEDSHYMDTCTATGGSESDSDSEQVL